MTWRGLGPRGILQTSEHEQYVKARGEPGGEAGLLGFECAAVGTIRSPG